MMTAEGQLKYKRKTLGRGFPICIMAIDGTWRRDGLLNAISDHDAELTFESSMQGLNLTEFFLLLSSTGLAYRRCRLVRVNGSAMEIAFLPKATCQQQNTQRPESTRTIARMNHHLRNTGSQVI